MLLRSKTDKYQFEFTIERLRYFLEASTPDKLPSYNPTIGINSQVSLKQTRVVFQGRP